MEAKYLTCANFLKENKCKDFIISNIEEIFEVQEDYKGNKASSIGDNTFKKANDICSDCDNYLTK